MFKKLLENLIEGRRKSALRRITEMQLYRLTEKELHDIGIGRGDIPRIIKEM